MSKDLEEYEVLSIDLLSATSIYTSGNIRGAYMIIKGWKNCPDLPQRLRALKSLVDMSIVCRSNPVAMALLIESTFKLKK
jgi:hypothetical protein